MEEEIKMQNGPVGAITLLLRAIGAGVLCLFIAWVGVLAIHLARIAKQSTGGLGAVAGGWAFLLRSPLVALVLAIAFGLGFYLAARWGTR